MVSFVWSWEINQVLREQGRENELDLSFIGFIDEYLLVTYSEVALEQMANYR